MPREQYSYEPNKAKYVQMKWHYQPEWSTECVSVNCKFKPRNSTGQQGHCRPLTSHNVFLLSLVHWCTMPRQGSWELQRTICTGLCHCYLPHAQEWAKPGVPGTARGLARAHYLCPNQRCISLCKSALFLGGKEIRLGGVLKCLTCTY